MDLLTGQDELAALIELRLLPRLDDVRRAMLLAEHGSAAAALQRSGVRARLDATARAVIDERVRRSLELVALERLRVTCITAPDYPRCFLELHDPPTLVFMKGDATLLERPAVAIVGSRRHTEYGTEVAREIAAGLSAAGVVVISGLARGIDSVAHEAALEGGTIAVLGCGIDVAYPREHETLAARIAREGLLVSEFAPGEPAARHHFPQRNRLIAALAEAVVVVEAAERSGALITAEHGMELGRDVMAVPGPVGRPASVGTNALLYDGAAMARSADDVLHAVGLAGGAPRRERPAPRLRGDDARVWSALADEPRHLDAVAREAGVEHGTLVQSLLRLELAGLVRQWDGKRYSR